MFNTSFRATFISLSTCAALLAAIFYGLKEYFYQYYENCAVVAVYVANLQIAGWCIPWRLVSVCIFVALLFSYYKIRKWMRRRTSPSKSIVENGPVLVSGKTLLEIHTANQNIKELSRRLDSVEKTTHLVMKQLEAMTKCMAEVLKEGKVRNTNNNKHPRSPPETHL